jgi:hypothetical protein
VLRFAYSKPKSALVTLFTLATLLLLCVVVGLRLVRRRNARRDAKQPWPFYAKRPLPGPEQVLHQRLVSALPGHIVMSRVPLSGVLGIKRGHDTQTWDRRIRPLQYDFVVCAKDSTVLLAIELQGSARHEKTPAGTDQIKERASAAAGVRIVRWHARALPGHAEIQAEFGVPLNQVFEEFAPGANASWWPPVSSGTGSRPDT